MSAPTPPHIPAPTPDELGEFGTRMAAALDGCVAIATTLVDEAGSLPGRRPSGPLYELLGGFDPQLGDLGRAFRESGNRWPRGAGDSWTAVYDTLVNGLYSTASRLVRSLADERRGQWVSEELEAAVEGDAGSIRLLYTHADYIARVAANVRAAGWEYWQVVNLEGEQREWLDRFNAGHRDGTALIGALRRGAAAPRLTGLSMKVVAGSVPSRCRDSLPQISAAELERADRMIRQTVAIPDGMTTHWVGEEGSRRGVCRCHPDAPYAAPEQVERYLPRDGATGSAVKAATGRKSRDAFALLSAAQKSTLEVLKLPESKGKSAKRIVKDYRLHNVTLDEVRKLRKLLSNKSAVPNLAHEQT